jgi:hypothetical protein
MMKLALITFFCSFFSLFQFLIVYFALPHMACRPNMNNKKIIITIFDTTEYFTRSAR